MHTHFTVRVVAERIRTKADFACRRSTLLQAKNYRKPLLQRHVVRIFMLVPIFSAASWASLTSLRVAFWIDPFRDVYEAFTLYTFFQLLVNFLGGERSLIIMMHGRKPVDHLWPLDLVLDKVDIGDPHTFLSIKRGILQYAYIKPVLAIATVAMKATDTFKEGIISVDSGYFWTGLIYNISICLSLYDLALFWVCMSDDLQPFRPMPKFLCIKGIIFASWWQGFFLSILVWLGAIPSVGGGYTADNLAAAIQDALICFEMPLFAVSHWYAFSWKDYADRTISDARMPVKFALRDVFGPRDLIEDAKETLSGQKYDYRHFDAGDNVMAHEESRSRRARMKEGMRYERGGRGKYWIPSAGPNGAKQPLLSRFTDSHARTMSPGSGGKGSRSTSRQNNYGATDFETEEPELEQEEERLYNKARQLEFGDWNYPVINTHFASREDRLYAEPSMLSASTNRAILQPTADNRKRRESRIKSIQDESHQHGKPRAESSSSTSGIGAVAGKGKERLESLPVVGKLVRHQSSDSAKSKSSQLVDLVVEDYEAEEVERIRARKEGGPGWNAVERKHFVNVYDENGSSSTVGETVRQGYNPDAAERGLQEVSHDLAPPTDAMHAIQDDEGVDESGAQQPWEHRRYGESNDGVWDEERNAWGGAK